MTSTKTPWRSWAFDGLIALFLIFLSKSILVSVLQRGDSGDIGLVALRYGSVVEGVMFKVFGAPGIALEARQSRPTNASSS
ncbi:MAG: hypothetical protein M3277_09625 [Actinomycetota bacterium]|nr:hypothetical protein [Actinomycetota bacterium]